MSRLKLLACFLLVAVAALAQVNSTITGTITDPTGAVVPNAMLQLKNQDTGAVYSGGTSATGVYVFTVAPGTYELTVTQQGFKKVVRQNLAVATETSVRQDIKLEVGGTTESVVVSDTAPLLKTESADISHTVTSDRADNLPVLTLNGNIRNPLQVVNLLAGATFEALPFGGQNVRVNGLPSNTMAIRIEGQDATNGIWKEQTQIAQSGMDAIQEVAIQTSNYAAEFGQAGGGYFNMTMKSGTNQFHGSGYSYIVNEAFNAGTPNTNAGDTNSVRCHASMAVPVTASTPAGYLCTSGDHTVNKLRRLDYGFTIGGPIKIPHFYNGHDKTFFFFNFEQYRQATSNNTGTATVPTPDYTVGNFCQAANVGTGAIGTNCPGGVGNPGTPTTQVLTWTGCAKNASGQCIDANGNIILRNALYDPLTAPGPDNTYRSLFTPFNQIPLSRLDPVAVAVQNLLPKPLGPNAGNVTSNYAIPFYTNFNHTTNPSIKIDHSISPTMKISGYASEIYTTSPNANGFNSFPFEGTAAQADVSRTFRLNYDQTITPTLLLHLGAGYLWTYNPTDYPAYDPSQPPPKGIGLVGFDGGIFPQFTGLSDSTVGGNSIALGAGGGFPRLLWDEKPTGNANLTWVKNNHTFKLGLDLTLEGFVHRSAGYANGNLTFAASNTGLPAGLVAPISQGLSASTGFGYASFLLGQVSQESVSGRWAARIGNKAVGMYLQDTWKLTRKLTLDYGLRYDYQTYLKESYGRLINVSLDTPNPAVGGRLGAVIFEGYNADGVTGRCNCTYASNYPYAIGPRVGIAYQIDPKTVLRIGAGLAYGTEPENAQLSYNIGQAITILPPGSGFSSWPVVNAAGNELVGGNPYRRGNPYGNPPVVWPNFDPGQYPSRSGTQANPILTPGTPLTGNLDRNMGLPPRILSWSVGLQREVMRDLVVEAAYVGNRGVWWEAPALQDMMQNPLRPDTLLSQYGLNIYTSTVNPTTGAITFPDQNLLTGNLTSSTSGVLSRGWTDSNGVLHSFATPAYPGMPLTQSVGQQLRPFPQFPAINPFLGPPLGDTWYDSLQAKATKRYSHGLDLQAAFTWQKEFALGVNSGTSYFTPGPLAINDIFNRNANKTISSLSRPFQLVVSGSYTTPRTKGDSMALKVVSQAVRDWQLGVVLRYQSGQIMQLPGATNQIFTVLQRFNPFYTLAPSATRIPGVPLFQFTTTDGKIATDPNCKCFDPFKTLLINAAAYQDLPRGQFGISAPFQTDYRWMRQPSEAMSFARNFKMGPERKYNLQIRGEFQNVFNRRFYGAPVGIFGAPAINTPTTTNTTAGNRLFGSLSGGLGFVNAINGAGSTPRSGQMVARFTF